jgi:CBS domain-containing protein
VRARPDDPEGRAGGAAREPALRRDADERAPHPRPAREPESPSRGLSILTGKDCIRVICDAGVAALDDLCVEDAMTRPAVTVPADLCINDCLRLMRMAGVRTAPVVEHGELVGVLTFTDVLNSLRLTRLSG